MKKYIAGAVAGAALLVSALPAFAAPAAKVEVCHVVKANDVIPFGFPPGPPTVTLYFGKEISVSENALDAHLEHGDYTSYFGGEVAEGPITAFRNAGAMLPAADCYGVGPLEP